MDNNDFRNKVKQGLESLNYEQKVRFAWLCAVRALPFLGYKGDFNFWKDEDRQRYIQAVFFALDCSYTGRAPYAASASTASAASSAYASAASVASSAVYATSSAAYVDAYAAAVYATTTYTSAASHHPARRFNKDLESIILCDLNRIKTPSKDTEHNRTDWYGEIWDNFQTALKKEGCVYWGQLYKQIFDEGFILNSDALEKRLSIPIEIRNQGAASIADYLEEIGKGSTQLNEARIIILGEKGAGKTCIARRLVDPDSEMTTLNESTAGVDTTLWKLDEDNINVRIWDFAGHTVTHAVHQFFLSERCLYILVYDGRTEERNRLVYWLDHMKNYGGDSSAIILVNKRDRHSVDLPINFLKEKYPIAGIYNFSIKDDANDLLGFRKDMAEYIKNNPSWKKELVPKHYFKVKEELEKCFAKHVKGNSQEHITKDKFNEIAELCEVEDAEKLLVALHSLGVSLWYRNMENFNTLVLNPEWISHGVYQIINWVSNKKKYSLNIEDFEKVFKENRNRYPKDKHYFFFELMRRFELAYKVKDEEKLMIPHLLMEDRPKKLPDFPVGEGLMLRYSAEQPLPPNTISRFIVRHNREIKKEGTDYRVWRHGVLLEKENTIALVREEDRTISVSVKGSNKTNYISELRETLNDIFDSYKSDKPELQYRVERHGQIPDEVEEQYPLWIVDRNVVGYHEENRLYYDVITKQDISLEDTVRDFNVILINQGNMNGGVVVGEHVNDFNKNTFNFQDCNFRLQGDLNNLALLLTESGKSDEANELSGAAKALEQVEQCESGKELKKSGIANRLERLFDSLSDENSTLHKTVKGIKNGVTIAQDIAKRYNDIAQWAGLPQVPKPFLK